MEHSRLLGALLSFIIAFLPSVPVNATVNISGGSPVNYNPSGSNPTGIGLDNAAKDVPGGSVSDQDAKALSLSAGLHVTTGHADAGQSPSSGSDIIDTLSNDGLLLGTVLSATSSNSKIGQDAMLASMALKIYQSVKGPSGAAKDEQATDWTFADWEMPSNGNVKTTVPIHLTRNETGPFQNSEWHDSTGQAYHVFFSKTLNAWTAWAVGTHHDDQAANETAELALGISPNQLLNYSKPYSFSVDFGENGVATSLTVTAKGKGTAGNSWTYALNCSDTTKNRTSFNYAGSKLQTIKIADADGEVSTTYTRVQKNSNNQLELASGINANIVKSLLKSGESAFTKNKNGGQDSGAVFAVNDSTLFPVPDQKTDEIVKPNSQQMTIAGTTLTYPASKTTAFVYHARSGINVPNKAGDSSIGQASTFSNTDNYFIYQDHNSKTGTDQSETRNEFAVTPPAADDTSYTIDLGNGASSQPLYYAGDQNQGYYIARKSPDGSQTLIHFETGALNKNQTQADPKGANYVWASGAGSLINEFPTAAKDAYKSGDVSLKLDLSTLADQNPTYTGKTYEQDFKVTLPNETDGAPGQITSRANKVKIDTANIIDGYWADKNNEPVYHYTNGDKDREMISNVSGTSIHNGANYVELDGKPKDIKTKTVALNADGKDLKSFDDTGTYYVQGNPQNIDGVQFNTASYLFDQANGALMEVSPLTAINRNNSAVDVNMNHENTNGKQTSTLVATYTPKYDPTTHALLVGILTTSPNLTDLNVPKSVSAEFMEAQGFPESNLVNPSNATSPIQIEHQRQQEQQQADTAAQQVLNKEEGSQQVALDHEVQTHSSTAQTFAKNAISAAQRGNLAYAQQQATLAQREANLATNSANDAWAKGQAAAAQSASQTAKDAINKAQGLYTGSVDGTNEIKL
jgi:hypothetical protein